MMFTPQRKGWSGGWSSTPRPGPVSSGMKNARGRGKAAVADAPAPPLGSLEEDGGAAVVNYEAGGGDPEVWRRFREAGLLDEASLEQKDREALQQQILKLEGELYDYQYNMGLLLIEKKEWTLKYEELTQRLDEAQEIVKREQAAHLIAFSEVEKREENLRKALGVEKQCVADLEKALHDLRSESAGVKFSSDEKLAEAHAMVAGIQEKSLEVEAKLHAADAKLAEASRKSSEIDRKLQEVESRESALQLGRLSFSSEKEAHESALLRQREELREWEKKLEEGQRRLSEDQGLLNRRESRLNETDKILSQKERDLEDTRKKIEADNLKLKENEATLCTRQVELGAREEEAVMKWKNLERKEQELLALEEELNAREKVAVQQLIDEHTAVLDGKKKQFELEMDEKRKSVDEEMKSKLVLLEQKEEEIVRKEKELNKRENAVDKKFEKVTEKEKNLESKMKALKETEKNIKSEKKELDMEKKRQETDKQELLNLKAGIANDRTALEESKKQILKEQEILKVTEDERTELQNLQAQLRAEKENWRIQKELILKEREDLKQEKEKFENEWDELDEKKVEIEKKLKQLEEERERFTRWKEVEEERLEREKMVGETKIQMELETLQLEKAKHAALIDQERSELIEKAQSEQYEMVHKFECQKHELETSLQREREEMNKQLQEKITAFEEEKTREMNNIVHLREQCQREMEKVELQNQTIEEEKQKIAKGRQDLEGEQVMIKKDIEELSTLLDNVKVQRQKLVENSCQLRAFVEENKTCKNCGEAILSDIQLLLEIEDAKAPLPRQLSKGYFNEALKSGLPSSDISPGAIGSNSGSRLSWLRKCTKIFNLSPVSRVNNASRDPLEGTVLFGKNSNTEPSEQLDEAEVRHQVSIASGAVDNTVNGEGTQTENSNREMEDGHAPSVDQSDIGQSQGIFENLSGSAENVESKVPVPTYSKRGRRGGRLRATRSVKQVIKESQAIIGESAESNDKEEHTKIKDGHLAQVNEESQNHSHREDSRSYSVGRKRQHMSLSGEQEPDESEVRSESATTGRRKRRQTVVTGIEAPGTRRYNFRRSTVAGAATPAQRGIESEKDNRQSVDSLDGEKVQKDGETAGKLDKPTTALLEGDGFENDTGTSKHQTVIRRSVVEVHSEISLQKDVILRARDATEVTEEGAHGGVGEQGEEVNGRRDTEDGYETEEYVEESEDDSEKHNASVGKKLWNFFTT